MTSFRGNVEERKLGDHDPGTVLASSIRVTSNTIADGIRTVVATREFAGKTPDHYTFSATAPSIPLLAASGTGATFSYHGPTQRWQ